MLRACFETRTGGRRRDHTQAGLKLGLRPQGRGRGLQHSDCRRGKAVSRNAATVPPGLSLRQQSTETETLQGHHLQSLRARGIL